MNKFIFIIVVFFSTLQCLAVHFPEKGSREELFEQFEAFYKSALEELDYFSEQFFERRFELLERFLKKEDLQKPELVELVARCKEKFENEYNRQTEKITSWKKKFAYVKGFMPGKRMSNTHIVKLLDFVLNYSPSFAEIWGSYNKPHFEDLLAVYMRPGRSDFIEKVLPGHILFLYRRMSPHGELAPLVDKSYFLQRLGQVYPELLTKLKEWKPSAELSLLTCSGELNPPTTPPASKSTIEKPVKKEELEAKNTLGERYKTYKNSCQEFWHEFVSLCGKDWEKARAKFIMLLAANPNSLSSLEAMSPKFSALLDVNLLHEVYRGFFLHNNPDGFFEAWEEYHDATDLRVQIQAIAKANRILSGKSALEIRTIVDNFARMFKAADEEKLISQLDAISFFKIRSSGGKTLKEAIIMALQAEKILSLVNEKLKQEFNNEKRNTFKQIDSELTADNLLPRLQSILSHLGLDGHPYFNPEQADSPNFKIAMKAWRKASSAAFLRNISHLSEKERTSALARLRAIRKTYTQLLSNARDYRLFHDFLKKELRDTPKEIDVTLREIKIKNKEFFHKMLADEFSKIGYLYPLNRDKIEGILPNLFANDAERECFFTYHLLAANEVIEYLKQVKGMLEALNLTYRNARNKLHKVETSAFRQAQRRPSGFKGSRLRVNR